MVARVNVVAAIYLPEGRDPHFHASAACHEGGIRIRGSYRVNTASFAIHQGKYPCPVCWRASGYEVDRIESEAAS